MQGEDRPFSQIRKIILRRLNDLLEVLERDCDMDGVKVDFSKG